MVDIVWRNRAVRHLSEIYEYLQSRNPSAADDYVSELRQACLRLADFPESAPFYDKRYRCFPVRNHVVFYRYDRDEGRVFIAAVIDGRRDVAALIRGISEG